MIETDIPLIRLHNQRLIGSKFKLPVEVVAWQGAVQSQDYFGAKWAVAQRCEKVTEANMEQAVADGSILRTHLMRPTWHFVSPADIRWILALTAPRLNQQNAYRHRQLELDAATFAQSNAALERALQGDRQLTRPELGEVLANAGIPDPTQQRLAYLTMQAELDQVIVSGARRGKQITYALFAERVPPGDVLPREEGLAELTRRYFQSHGPAQIKDFCWWSGLTAADARAGIASLGSQIRAEEVTGKTFWFMGEPAIDLLQGPIAHLLPNYDEGFASYTDYSPSIHPHNQAQWDAEHTISSHYLVMNGWVAGTWKRIGKKALERIEYLPFDELSESEHAAVAAAGRQFETYIDSSVEVALVKK